MTIDEIRKNAPVGATHYIVIDGIAIYVLKKGFITDGYTTASSVNGCTTSQVYFLGCSKLSPSKGFLILILR